jgi:hypothetical protein
MLDSPPTEQTEILRYRTLLEVSESIASHRELVELFHDLAPRLHRVVEFDFINLILHDAERNVMRSNLLEAPSPNYACPSGECPIETPGGWVWQTQQPWVVSAISTRATSEGNLAGSIERSSTGLRAVKAMPDGVVSSGRTKS